MTRMFSEGEAILQGQKQPLLQGLTSVAIINLDLLNLAQKTRPIREQN